jgi:hypothetical protein
VEQQQEAHQTDDQALCAQTPGLILAHGPKPGRAARREQRAGGVHQNRDRREGQRREQHLEHQLCVQR